MELLRPKEAHLWVHLTPPTPERKWQGSAFSLGSQIQEIHAELYRPGVVTPSPRNSPHCVLGGPEVPMGSGCWSPAALCGCFSLQGSCLPQTGCRAAQSTDGHLDASSIPAHSSQPSGSSPPWPVATIAQAGGAEEGNALVPQSRRRGRDWEIIPLRGGGVQRRKYYQLQNKPINARRTPDRKCASACQGKRLYPSPEKLRRWPVSTGREAQHH